MGRQRRLRLNNQQYREQAVAELAKQMEFCDPERTFEFCKKLTPSQIKWIMDQVHQHHKAIWDRYYEAVVLPKTLSQMGLSREDVVIERQDGLTMIRRLKKNV